MHGGSVVILFNVSFAKRLPGADRAARFGDRDYAGCLPHFFGVDAALRRDRSGAGRVALTRSFTLRC